MVYTTRQNGKFGDGLLLLHKHHINHMCISSDVLPPKKDSPFFKTPRPLWGLSRTPPMSTASSPINCTPRAWGMIDQP